MMRGWIVKGLRQVVLRLSDKRSLASVDVRVWFLEEAERLVVWEKLEAAIPLVERYSPRTMGRLKEHVDIVLAEQNFGHNHGAWHRTDRLVTLDYGWILAPETAPVHIASTLVHEVTHAWLEALGFQYRADRRARLEAVCFRAMAAFARRVPNGDDLSRYYEGRAEWALSLGGDGWTDSAFRGRALAALRNLEADMRARGIPELAIQAMRRVSGASSV